MYGDSNPWCDRFVWRLFDTVYRARAWSTAGGLPKRLGGTPIIELWCKQRPAWQVHTDASSREERVPLRQNWLREGVPVSFPSTYIYTMYIYYRCEDKVKKNKKKLFYIHTYTNRLFGITYYMYFLVSEHKDNETKTVQAADKK